MAPTTWPDLARAVLETLAARGPLRRSALMRALAGHPSFRDVDADEAFEALLSAERTFLSALAERDRIRLAGLLRTLSVPFSG